MLGDIDCMEKKKIDFDKVNERASRTTIKEKKPIKLGYLIMLFICIMILLVWCFLNDEHFSINQMSFLGIFGASIISIFTIVVTLNYESRERYITAKKSAALLARIIDSTCSQINQIMNGSLQEVVYPHDWLRYYENCYTYLRYNYLPYLLQEFNYIDKINAYVAKGDKGAVERLIKNGAKRITDSTQDFDIISAQFNLSCFAYGFKEQPPWTQSDSYKKFKKYVIDNYCNDINELTIQYLKDNDGRVDTNDAEYYIIEHLRNDERFWNDEYNFSRVQNKELLKAIFSIYLEYRPREAYDLVWGELILNDTDKEQL